MIGRYIVGYLIQAFVLGLLSFIWDVLWPKIASLKIGFLTHRRYEILGFVILGLLMAGAWSGFFKKIEKQRAWRMLFLGMIITLLWVLPVWFFGLSAFKNIRGMNAQEQRILLMFVIFFLLNDLDFSSA